MFLSCESVSILLQQYRDYLRRYDLNWAKNDSSTLKALIGLRPNSSCSIIVTNFPPSTSSIGGTPSRTASFLASEVNAAVVMMIPLSARPCIAPRKSRTWLGVTGPA